MRRIPILLIILLPLNLLASDRGQLSLRLQKLPFSRKASPQISSRSSYCDGSRFQLAVETFATSTTVLKPVDQELLMTRFCDQDVSWWGSEELIEKGPALIRVIISAR